MCKLALIQSGIEAVLGKQFLVLALLHDVAVRMTRILSASRMVDRRCATIKLVRRASWCRTPSES